MNAATDACMLFAVCRCRPFFFLGAFPHNKRYVRSCVVVFLFRGNLKKERRVRDDEKTTMQNASSSLSVSSKSSSLRWTTLARARIEKRRNLRAQNQNHLAATASSSSSSVSLSLSLLLTLHRNRQSRLSLPATSSRRALAMRASTERWEKRPQSGCHRRYHHREKTPVGDKNGRNCPQELEPIGRGKEEEEEEEEVFEGTAET